MKKKTTLLLVCLSAVSALGLSVDFGEYTKLTPANATDHDFAFHYLSPVPSLITVTMPYHQGKASFAGAELEVSTGEKHFNIPIAGEKKEETKLFIAFWMDRTTLREATIRIRFEEEGNIVPKVFWLKCQDFVTEEDDDIQTRGQLFAPITDRNMEVSPERRYVEIDLNADEIEDLILSESVSFGGTGGLVYNLYLGVGDNRFRRIDRFLAGIMATDVHGGTTRLWFYSHLSAGSGTIEYRHFDRKGEYQKSQVLTIHPGDGGSDIGNGIYSSIFNDKTMLKMKTCGASNQAPHGTVGGRADASPDSP